MNKEQTAKQLMEEGWKKREAWDFEKAEDLLTKAMDLFEEQEDWFNVTECLNHLAYSYKIQSKISADCGISTARESLELAEEANTKKKFVLRALLSLSSQVGNYEAALKYVSEFVELAKDPIGKADGLRHMAYFQLRTGDIAGAEKTINEARDLFEAHRNEMQDPHKSIWEVSLLLTEGSILYNKGEKDKAQKIGEEALALAQEKKLETRVLEAEEFLTLLIL